jgi:hypothetical protein
MIRRAFLLCCSLIACAAMAADPAPQKAKIDAALARFLVEPAPPARVFFLGFAGYGEERVFAEEVKLASRLVADRYGTAQRSLLLVNDRRNRRAWPLATHENLRYALREIGRRMNPESDVLFLLLSSHGSSNGMVEVSMPGSEPSGLSAPTLAKFLDAAGIRNRVIVVSACFSGAFIEPLANDDSIVITAAARDRTSFGCSDDRHLTYFGEAFFRDALPEAASLREAFDATSAWIETREAREKLQHSQPQAQFGARMEQRMAELEPPAAVPAD